MVVVYSKEKPLHCGNCKAKLATACFRCLDCAEIVSCPKCDPRTGFHEDEARPTRPFDHPPCPRGGLSPRGRGEGPHFACPRGGFSARGRGFDSPDFPCPRDGFSARGRGFDGPRGGACPSGGFSPRGSFDSQHRPSFSTTIPFPGANRGGGFGPRGLGDFPLRCPFPASFGPMSEEGGMNHFSEMHGRGFGPFAPRGGPGISRGIPGRGMARGRGGFCRGRGGFPPFTEFQGHQDMACNECECTHLRVFPEVVEENAHDEMGGACSCDVPEMGEENIPEERGVADVVPEKVEPESIDHEG